MINRIINTNKLSTISDNYTDIDNTSIHFETLLNVDGSIINSICLVNCIYSL